MRELVYVTYRSCNDRVFRAVCRRFALYAVIVEGAADGSPAGSGESSARPRILLVEDDPTIRQMTQLALERDGFAVSTAHDGASGLAAFRAQPPDLVILDVMLPGVDGVSVCRTIREQQRRADRDADRQDRPGRRRARPRGGRG